MILLVKIVILSFTSSAEEEGLDKQIFLDRLVDSANLIAHLSFKTTTNRKAAILPLLTKLYKDAAAQVATDKYLFGTNFSIKLKEARAVDKISKEIRVNNTPKFSPSFARRNLNSRSPALRMPLNPILGNQGQLPQPKPKFVFNKPKMSTKNSQVQQNQPRFQPYRKNK